MLFSKQNRKSGVDSIAKTVLDRYKQWLEGNQENFSNISKIKIFTLHIEKQDNLTTPTASEIIKE